MEILSNKKKLPENYQKTLRTKQGHEEKPDNSGVREQ
jgi:hypothetical protein